MTKDEFQDSYYEYMTSDGAAAKAEAAKVNATGIDGDSAIAVQFGDLWCLMLKDAYDFTRVLGIDSAT